MNKTFSYDRRNVATIEPHFDIKEEAMQVIQNAKEVSEFYGFLTVADFKNLCSLTVEPNDDTFGWTKNTLERAVIERVTSSEAYKIRMPEYDWGNYWSTPSATDEKTQSETGEPINITISSGEWDTRRHDIEDVLHLLFENTEKISDRPVFITLM